MHKKLILLLSVLSPLMLTQCRPNTDNNGTMSFDSLQVNFSANFGEAVIPDGAEVGILPFCTHNGQENTLMSESAPAVYLLSAADGNSVLTPKTDSDKAIAFAGDHGFKFYGIYPMPENFDAEATAVNAAVPAEQVYGAGTEYRFFATFAKATSVLATRNLEFSSFFTTVKLRLDRELADSDEPITLKSLKLESADPLIGLAGRGVVDMSDMSIAWDETVEVIGVTVSFPDGLLLDADYTEVPVVIVPTEVPEGGLKITMTKSDNAVLTTTVFSTEAGRKLAAGEEVSVIVGGADDGIEPVTWPVTWPLGYPGNDTSKKGHCNVANLPTWGSGASDQQTGYWPSPDQPQASAQWHWGEASGQLPAPKPFRELVNSAGVRVSTPGIKGAWTGDYLEYTIPVKKFAANSTLKFSIPICCKNSPVFWEVQYLDGDTWKSTATDNLPAYSGSTVTRRATWALPFAESRMQTVNMTFANAVRSGELKIRLICVDGTVVCTGENTVKTVEEPVKNNAGTARSGNFYFGEWDTDATVASGKFKECAISFELL